MNKKLYKSEVTKSNTGVTSIGVKAPMIVEGDNVKEILIQSIQKSGVKLQDGDVIGITESVVARAFGNYVTVNDIVKDLTLRGIPKDIALWNPIMSRNRFSLILRGFARYADRITIYVNKEVDEQGNPTHGINYFTGVDIQEYYREICTEEHCKIRFKTIGQHRKLSMFLGNLFNGVLIDARCHPDFDGDYLTLANFLKFPVIRSHNDNYSVVEKSGYNTKYGLLGSNKSDSEKLKLFPETKTAQQLVEDVQFDIKERMGVNVEVMIYGDGCFHSPQINNIPGSSINEFADPVTSPAYTSGLNGTPNEFKIKYIIDTQGKEAAEELANRHNNESLVGQMSSQGTTPRRCVDLLASLMDLTSGSGSRCTPFIVVKNYL